MGDFPCEAPEFFRPDSLFVAALFFAKNGGGTARSGAKKIKKRAARLNLFDGDRPGSVQKIIWSMGPDPDFFVDPRVGWTHKRPAALEATPIGSGRVGRLQDIGREGL